MHLVQFQQIDPVYSLFLCETKKSFRHSRHALLLFFALSVEGADSTAAHHETDQLRHQVGAGSSLLDVADPVRPNKRQRLEDNQHRRTPTFPESPKVAAIEFKNTTHLVQALQQSSDAQTVAGLFAGLLGTVSILSFAGTCFLHHDVVMNLLRNCEYENKTLRIRPIDQSRCSFAMPL